jgi:hypothetical protein
MDHVEVISVHYKTPNLIYEQYETVRKFYPTINYKIIDGSDDGIVYFEDLEKKDDKFIVNRFEYNIHHGPGMDYAIRTSDKNFVLILDSDVSLKSPVINFMIENFSGYAIGRKMKVNSEGYEKWQKTNVGDRNFIYDYIHPYCMLINKNEYLNFKPFIKHGAPCIESMIDIYNKKLTDKLIDFPIQDHINFEVRGTRKIWGMNL